MSSENIIGTISAVHCLSREIIWQVYRFSHFPRGGLHVIYSTPFMFQGQQWKLGLWPNYKPEYVLMYLMRKGASVISPSQTWKLELGLRLRDGSDQIVDSVPILKQVSFRDWGCSVMSRQLTRTLLEKETDAFWPGGSLIIFARLTVEGLPSVREITTQTVAEENGEEIPDYDEDFESGTCDQSEVEPVPSFKVLTTMSKDMKNLYLSEKDFDTTIKVGSVTFRVHKSILETRVPGITTMLSQESLLEACDPKNFNIFLEFVYSGDLEGLTIHNVVGLYGIADKFNVPELKDTCVSFMLSNLNVATVCDVLQTAVNRGENDLHTKATEFFFENAEEVFALPEWERFMVENPAQAQNLILGSLKYARRSEDKPESN